VSIDERQLLFKITYTVGSLVSLNEHAVEHKGHARDRREVFDKLKVIFAYMIACFFITVLLVGFLSEWSSSRRDITVADKFVSATLVLTIGVSLYILKHSRLQLLYGALEIVAATLGGFSTIVLMDQQSQLGTVALAASASVYIAVRGLENAIAGIGRFRVSHSTNSWFYKITAVSFERPIRVDVKA
jgi:hypothetical protein